MTTNASDPALEVPREPEEFHFALWGFDITAVRAMLAAEEPVRHVQLEVSAASRLLDPDPTTLDPGAPRTVTLFGVGVQWDHVEELPEKALDEPVFVAELGELGTLVIDGWHRVAKARRLGRETLPAILLSREQAQSVLLKGSHPIPEEKRVTP